MSNLLKETERKLAEAGYTWDDVVAIQGKEFGIGIARFKELADVEYSSGYGAQEVASDLVILMKDGSWFTRGEYDGSEWWEHHTAPKLLPCIHDDKVERLVVKHEDVGWCTLAECNGLKEG